jgi:uncharacterized membrane protein YgaE (UPF0421/DUF939 family)
VIVMKADLENLESEIKELEIMRDRVISLSDLEKTRLDQMLRDAKNENKSLKKELELYDRVRSRSSRKSGRTSSN